MPMMMRFAMKHWLIGRGIERGRPRAALLIGIHASILTPIFRESVRLKLA